MRERVGEREEILYNNKINKNLLNKGEGSVGKSRMSLHNPCKVLELTSRHTLVACCKRAKQARMSETQGQGFHRLAPPAAATWAVWIYTLS